MFDRIRIEKWIAIFVIVAFASLWSIFEYFIPKEAMLNSVAMIENAVQAENWQRAEEELSNLNSNWHQSKVLIQAANGTDEILVVEQLLAQSSNLIRIQDDDVIDHLGSLRAVLKSTAVAFPGP